MTFVDSIPIAKQLAENQLKKGFDVEAFLILCEINRMDSVPGSNIDEHISDIGKMFIEYYYSNDTEALNNLINRFIQTLSEIYHTFDTQDKKYLLKHELQGFIDMLD